MALMQPWFVMLATVMAVFAVIGVGVIARRANLLTEQADQSLIQLTVRILVPALILKVMLGNPLLREIKNVVLPPVVGFVTIVAGFALAALVAWIFRRSPALADARQRRTFAFCIGMYNYYYVPLPLGEQLFGQNTVAILMIHNLGVEIAFWTIGIMLVSGQLGGRWYTRVLNPPSVTIVVAMLINLTGLYRYISGPAHPAVELFLRGALNLLGSAAVPLGLLLVGATIADEYATARLDRALGVISLGAILRLGILPVLFLAIAFFIPASRELKQVILLQAAMPCAVFPVIVARHYGGDPATAVRVVVGTSLLSLLTTPAWLSAGLSFLHLAR